MPRPVERGNAAATATPDAPLVTCRDLTYSYRRAGRPLVVLDHLDLTVLRGEFLALMGPSGSGKTTLLNLIGALEQPTAGTIEVSGVDLNGLSPAGLAAWRSQTVGFVFQFYNLLPVLSALRNVELPLLLTRLSRRQRRQHARTALELVGLADRVHHKPPELSGGQQQRVAIARALVADPQLLVCDEPTGDLDRQTADTVLALLGTLNRDLGKTILMVTHDPKAAGHASRVVHMDKGTIVAAAA